MYQRYFYHSDHLGSSAWITDASGDGYQYIQYLPFGENWVEQRLGTFSTPYQFSGKEKDEETSYNYFGARYYDSELSIWLSVDPMADKFPGLSSYNYCVNNPVVVIDPDGKEIVILGDEEYRVKIQSILDKISNSGKAGKYLVTQAVKSERTLVIANTKADVPNELSQGNGYAFLSFDLGQTTGNHDVDNGDVIKTPETCLAHELAHFMMNKPFSFLINEKGYATYVPASEVEAVEWENRVRNDLGLPQRNKYAGINVAGKEAIPSEKYEGYSTLRTKKDYAGDFKSNGLNTNYRKSIEPRRAYARGGVGTDKLLKKPIPSTVLRLKY